MTIRDLTYVGEGIIPAPLHGDALRYTPLPKDDVDAIAVHHWTGWTPPETWAVDEEIAYILTIDQYHRTGRGLDGIGYHICPFPSGRVYITARLDRYGAGVGGENDHTIHIGLPGTFNLQAPSARHLEGAVKATAHSYEHLGRDVPTRPHRYWPATGTTCPGDKWPLWVPQLEAQALKEEDDMTPQEVRDIVREMRFHAIGPDGEARQAVATLGRWFGILVEHKYDDSKHGSGGGYTDAKAVKAVKDKLS